MNTPTQHPVSGARILADGEVITEAGIYADVPMTRYHGPDLCAGPSISSSGLRTIFNQSPAHFWNESPLNPDRISPKEKEAFIFGRAAHHLLLGESDFGKHFSVLPDEFPDFKTKAAREWRDAEIAAGKTVLRPSDLDAIRGMARQMAANPLVAAGILNGSIEQTLAWRDPDTGIWLKARPDAIPADGNDVADLKTTGSVEYDALAKTVAELGYAMQGALIRMGFREALSRDMNSFSLVFVEKTAPFCCRVVTLKEADLDDGERAVKASLALFKRCLERGEWPGPGGTQADAEYLELPQWARGRTQARIDHLTMELSL